MPNIIIIITTIPNGDNMETTHTRYPNNMAATKSRTTDTNYGARPYDKIIVSTLK